MILKFVMSYKDADLLKLYAQGKRDIPNLLFPDGQTQICKM